MSPATGLRRAVHHVSDVALGGATRFQDGRLTLNVEELRRIFDDPALASVAISVVHPGESARIVKVLDAVEPRAKPRDADGIFPGFVSPADSHSGSDTHVLRGAAVVTAGYLPRAQEALADMSGPAAALCFLASTHNVVVEFVPASGADWADVAAALRVGALRLANALATAAVETAADEVEDLTAPASPPAEAAGDRSLPRIGAITNLQTQGAFKDVYVRGRSLAGSPPLAVDAGEIEDGIVVSGQYGHPALKNPTFLHQNNPIVAALRARDGVDLRFAGLVLSPEPVEQAAKETTARQAAELCRDLGWDAAIVTKEGGGNADSDVSLKMDALEAAGVTAVGLFAEMAGADGSGPPVVAPPERATAMVSTGNYDQRLQLPAVDRALGGSRFDLLDTDASAAMEVPTAVVYAALSPLGWGRLTASADG
ncbi:MAG TPA: glycine/sarcosine/betaine reductase component B subunit [Candidatus Dormibacteraeota bacterium]